MRKAVVLTPFCADHKANLPISDPIEKLRSVSGPNLDIAVSRCFPELPRGSRQDVLADRIRRPDPICFPMRSTSGLPGKFSKVLIEWLTADWARDKQLATFTLPLPEEIARRTADDDRPHKELKIGVMLPENFDSSKPQKFLFVWTPVNGKADQERGSIPTVRAFAGEAVPLGWAVFAIDTDIGYPDGDHYPEIVLQGLSTLEAAIPSFKDSIFACGGFSGGAKNCATASGALIKKGYKLRGILMAGCNQDLLEQAQKTYKANKSNYKEVKGFLSNGKEDRTASVAAAEGAADSLDSNGMNHIRRETFEGGHQLHKPHIGEALRWFEAE